MLKSKAKVLSMMLCILMLTSVFSVFLISASALSNDVIGIESGTVYYIKNLIDGKYLDVYNGSDSDGNNVWTYTFNATAAQKWRVVRNTDGTYTFFAMVSTHNRVLDVTGSNVDIWNYHSTWSYQKFTLIRDTTLNLGGTYKIKNGSKYVVSDPMNETVKVQSNGNGLDAFWSFEPVEKGDADIYTFYYQKGTILGLIPTYYDSTGAASTFKKMCTNMGYQSYYFKNKPASYAYEQSQCDSIWVFRGHGSSRVINNVETPVATISFKTDDGNDNGHITTDYRIVSHFNDKAINSLSSNSLAKERCVLYIGCNTGVSFNDFNLVNSTFNKGAHFALGTTKKIKTYKGDNWTEKFFTKANTGATIRQCLDYANYYEDIGLLYYEGDVYAKLK